MKPFPNAPLVEILAELHWLPTAPLAGAFPLVPNLNSPVPVLTDGGQEQFFSNISTHSGDHGFDRVERMIPLGFPALPQQPVFRFRSTKRPSELLQVGHGMFSVNGLRPYSSWESFKPVISSGLELLFASRMPGIPGPITEVILKYVDLFDDSLLGRKKALQFCNQVAGLDLRLPEVMRDIAKDSENTDINLSVKFELGWGAELRIVIADGHANGKSGVVMDTTISMRENLPQDTAGILSVLDRAHDDVRRLFLAMTQPITDLMQKG
jgi:uncharacterized protein (TIGR04255 family)